MHSASVCLAHHLLPGIEGPDRKIGILPLRGGQGRIGNGAVVVSRQEQRVVRQGLQPLQAVIHLVRNPSPEDRRVRNR